MTRHLLINLQTHVTVRYCSQGNVPRGVFVCISHENPELFGAKWHFLPFLCIAERVIPPFGTLTCTLRAQVTAPNKREGIRPVNTAYAPYD